MYYVHFLIVVQSIYFEIKYPIIMNLTAIQRKLSMDHTSGGSGFVT
jgi:hypothetical protein